MSRDYDEQTADMVRRTLAAVSAATPIAPPRVGELIQEVERGDHVVPLVHRDEWDDGGGRATPPRRRAVALAAAVLAVVLAVTATWIARSDHDREAPPATRTSDGALSERLEPGWLSDEVAGAGPVRTATPGLDVEPDAAVSSRPRGGAGGGGAGLEGAVVATADVDDPAADAMAAALARIVQADRSMPASSGVGGHTGDGRPISVASWIDVGDDLLPLVDQVTGGARPADATAPGWTTTPIDVAWVPGIARSETVRYGDPYTGPWAEVATTVGRLPEPAALEALLPLAERIRLGDHDAWAVTRTNGSAGGDQFGGMWTVLWQETDGLVGSVTTSGIAWEDVQRIANDARLVDDPAPATVAQPRPAADGHVDGVAYTVEAWEDSWRGLDDGAVTVCWRVRIGGQAGPVPRCQPPDGTFGRNGEVGGHLVLGAIVAPDIAAVQVVEGTVTSTDVVPLGEGSPRRAQLAVVLATEADAHDAVVSLVNDQGEAVGTIELLFE